MSTDRELPPLPDLEAFARLAGLADHGIKVSPSAISPAERFAALIAEDCAKLVQSLRPCMRGDCDDLAAAIRARYKAE